MSPSSPETNLFAASDALKGTRTLTKAQVAAIEARARRDALLALRATVEGLPNDWDKPGVGVAALSAALAMQKTRVAVLAAIEHQLGEMP